MRDKPIQLSPANKSGVVIKVSLVEDDPRVRGTFVDWLNHAEGLQLIGKFADAETALENLPREQPDVAVVDINLPGLSGIDCVRQLKGRLPGTQFIMVTVYSDAERIFEALSAGASGYLLKQTPREELISAIREVHQGSSPMSGSIARKVVQFFQKRTSATSKLDGLSAREQEVLELLSRGYLYKEIAETLGVRYDTVTTYGRRIYEKLHVHSRAQAVAIFGQHQASARLPK